MKIFISHASANKDYGDALVELLRSTGVKETEIIFTSNTAYGIPIGQNIFNWLKSQISEKPFVIYLLSKEYYTSVACLNEMGAAWIIENEHAALFTPDFNINSKEFQSGALDPREIGFHINDEERLLAFIQQLSKYFQITTNPIIINQKVRKYLYDVRLLEQNNAPTINETSTPQKIITATFTKQTEIIKPEILNVNVDTSNSTSNDTYSKFTNEILSNKLRDEELILIHYMVETSKIRLGTGWQQEYEINNIKAWEDIKELNNKLSDNYAEVIRRFALRGYTEVSAITSSSNPKEIKLKIDIELNLLCLPTEVLKLIDGTIKRNILSRNKVEDDGLPF